MIRGVIKGFLEGQVASLKKGALLEITWETWNIGVKAFLEGEALSEVGVVIIEMENH